ncbi:MAG: glycosyltransferase [Acidobacteria bacterium]|nr:glycosyltransferase [Acidobacteriota bacterium]
MNIVCVSHLRWHFVFQRPQHLLSRAAKTGAVLYVEEPILGDGPAHIEVTRDATGVLVAVPHLPATLSPDEHRDWQRRLLGDAIRRHVPGDFVVWFYTPMALLFTHGLDAAAVVYDCMDELSAFAGAPPELQRLEAELFRRAHVVFTGGQTLYEAKRASHANVHAFPSSVDVAHFARARHIQHEPADQAGIPGPRIGFFGVIDERMDYGLLAGVAAARPDWHLVLVGPTAKVDPVSLPRAANVHYLGGKTYAQLPDYIAGWDVAMLPFARNDATRYISPTKTPEYLAAGKPVVSTSIRDVVRPYGQQGLARIADTVEEFVAAVEAALREEPVGRLRAADAFLTHMSWDGTWLRMRQQVEQAIAARKSRGETHARNAS